MTSILIKDTLGEEILANTREAMKKIFIFFIFLLSLTMAQAQEEVLIDSSLLGEAKKLPHSGKLGIEKNGFVYLRVSEQFKTTLFPILYSHLSFKDKNCLVPNNNPEGIHITVFSPKSITNEQIKQLPLGQNFDFYISAIMKFSKKNKDGSNVDWYVLKVNSDEIDKLREKILPSMAKSHLHISIALSKYHGNGKCACMCNLLLID